MKVAYVTESGSRLAGGMYVSARTTAIDLVRSGFDLHVYCLRDQHSEMDATAWSPIAPKFLDSPIRQLGYARNLSHELTTTQPDLVHQHGIWRLFSAQLARWRESYSKPQVLSPRGMLDPWALNNSRLKKNIAWFLYEHENVRGSTCIHALNKSEASSIRRLGIRVPIAIIPNGIHLSEGSPYAAAAQRGERKLLLFLGRIHPKKNLASTILGWSEAIRMRPQLADDWMFVIAGWDDGDHEQALRDLVTQHSLTDTIQFVGPAHHEAKQELLSKASAFVLASHSEGLPMAVLEAWARSLPVFMTDACNIPEAFSEGAAVRIGTSPQTIAHALAEHLPDPDLPSIGVKGRDLLLREYTSASVSARFGDLYKWLGDGAAKPAFVD